MLRSYAQLMNFSPARPHRWAAFLLQPHCDFAFQVVAPAPDGLRPSAAVRSHSSDTKLVPTRSAAELVGAAGKQGSGRMSLLAAGLCLRARATEKLLHLRKDAGAGNRKSIYLVLLSV